MEKVTVVCVFDAVAKAYLQPRFYDNPGTAIRAFGDAVMKDEHMKAHSTDYVLCEVATFYPESGKIVSVDVPSVIAKASSYIKN